jgi:adenylyltransferase/sulfurtransferase
MKRVGRARRVSYSDLYCAQLGIFGREGQQRLRRACVHVSGLGGLGSQILFGLAAQGVGRLTANDPQRLEADNLNRFPTATLADIGMPKAQLVERALRSRPYLAYQGIVARNEQPAVDPFYAAADVIVCCSNTVQSRVAAATKAVRLGKPLIDAAVSDGTRQLAGAVKIRLPEEGSWSACPACYLQQQHAKVPRGEALFFPLLAATAALASHAVVEFISSGAASFQNRNLVLIDLREFRLASFSVGKKRDCVACGSPRRHGVAVQIPS